MMPGSKHSEESKRKIGLFRKGKTSPNKGNHYSEETLQKMRSSHKGFKHSEETKKKISETHKLIKFWEGKKQSKELIQKRTENRKGYRHSEETKKKIAESQKGEKSKKWRGGISFEPYCPKFDESFKEKVRSYFGNQCIECGTPQNEVKLSVHHINFNKMTCCDGTVPLFVPLCRSCHTKTNYNREYWEKYFTEIINLYYGGKCYFTEEEMLNGGKILCCA